MCTGDVKKEWDKAVDNTKSSLADASDNLHSSLTDAYKNAEDSAHDVLSDNWQFIAGPAGFLIDNKQQTWKQGGPIIDIGLNDPDPKDSSGNSGGGASDNPPMYDNPDITDTDIRRRKSVARMRRGMFETMKTSGSGLLTRPSVDIPTLYGGLKTKLGQ
jgi:uncharacterized protein YjbJ (UPF0337 family)